MSELYPNEQYIGPPNEAFSAIIRVTKGCAWGRCSFCGIYQAMGVAFEMRPVAAVLADIDRAVELYGADQRRFFFGDADPISIPPDDFVAIAEHLCRRFPQKERLTAYGRAATAWRRRRELGRLREAGLDRLHVGLETSDDALLRTHNKGISKRRNPKEWKPASAGSRFDSVLLSGAPNLVPGEDISEYAVPRLSLIILKTLSS